MRLMTWTEPPDQHLIREWEYLYARNELREGRTATYSRGEPGTPRPTLVLTDLRDLERVFPAAVRRSAERRDRASGR